MDGVLRAVPFLVGIGAAIVAVAGEPISSTPVRANRATVLGTDTGVVAVVAGAGLTLARWSPGAATVETLLSGAEHCASPAIATDGRTFLVGWSETEPGVGRRLQVQAVDSNGRPASEPVELVSLAVGGGDIKKPGLALAWNGHEYGALYIRKDGAEVVFQRLERDGRPRGAELVLPHVGVSCWVRLAASGNDFVAGWLTRDDRGRGGNALYVARLGTRGVEDLHDVDARMPVGGWSLAVIDRDRAIVAYDGLGKGAIDQYAAVVSWSSDFIDRRAVATSGQEIEYDPAVAVDGDTAYIFYPWYYSEFMGVDLRSLDLGVVGAPAKLESRTDASAAAEIKSTHLISTVDGLRAFWLDDRQRPYGRQSLLRTELLRENPDARALATRGMKTTLR